MVDEAPGADAPPKAERQQPPDIHVTDSRHPSLTNFKTISLKILPGYVKVLIECAHRLASLSGRALGNFSAH
jgi:hypothetical protein